MLGRNTAAAQQGWDVGLSLLAVMKQMASNWRRNDPEHTEIVFYDPTKARALLITKGGITLALGVNRTGRFTSAKRLTPDDVPVIIPELAGVFATHKATYLCNLLEPVAA